MGNTWQYGNAITLKGTFTDDLGVYADPSTIKLSVMTPAGVLTTYEYGVDASLIKQDTGRYEMDILANEIGIWYYRWFSDTPDEVSKEVFFEIIRVRTV